MPFVIFLTHTQPWMFHEAVHLFIKPVTAKRHLGPAPLPAANSYTGKTERPPGKTANVIFFFFLLFFPTPGWEGFSFALIPPLTASVYNHCVYWTPILCQEICVVIPHAITLNALNSYYPHFTVQEIETQRSYQHLIDGSRTQKYTPHS